MDIPHLLAHPEELNQETLYDLRRIVGVHPTYHAARILFLQNLFLLHDTTFDQELRRAALLVPDRRVLCNITQFGGLQPLLDRNPHPAAETQVATATQAQAAAAAIEPTRQPSSDVAPTSDPQSAATAPTAPQPPAFTQEPSTAPRRPRKKYTNEDTTLTLLDNFLDSTPAPLQRRRIKADPATDYMAYLTQADEADSENAQSISTTQAASATQPEGNDLRMDELIDGFITSYQNGIQLSENPAVPDDILLDPDEAPPTDHNNEPVALTTATAAPTAAAAATTAAAPTATAAATTAAAPTAAAPTTTAVAPAAVSSTTSPDAGLTETLAAIYIKQQKYDRALEVMTRMQATATSANPYLADQVRFLQKLAINSRHKR